MLKLSAALPLTLLLTACAPSGDESQSGGKADDLGSGSSPAEFRCNVVQVLDDNLLEEGLASIYDFDREGFPMFDSDSVEVSYRVSDLSELPDKHILSIGQFNFGLHSADDIVREVDEVAEFADTEYFTVEAKLADDDTLFKVRIFEANMLGYVTYFEEDPAACISREQVQCELTCGGVDCGCEDLAQAECTTERDLARVDCRGIEQPEFDAF